jgi:glutamyl-tRNA synthetase
MGLHWDEGPDVGGPFSPYRQSERKSIYQEYAQKLLDAGFAYKCFATDEELTVKKEQAIEKGLRPQYDGTWRDADPEEVHKKVIQGDPYTVRFKIPEGSVVTIEDAVRGTVTWDADASLGDFVLLRSNGMPVYNFCVAIDDISMGITHVIRAEEHLTNTLRQVLVFNALNKTHPQYAHCSLILGSDRSKLSKRHGAASLIQFANAGYLPEAMTNYLANLGWNDGSTKEIYTPEELINAFSIDRIIKSPAVFDVERLNFVNSQHIKNMSVDKLAVVLDAVLAGNENATLKPATETNEQYRADFMTYFASFSRSLLTVTVDAKKILDDILSYNFDALVASADSPPPAASNAGNVSSNNTTAPEHSLTDLLEDDFEGVVRQLVKDHDEKVFPDSSHPEFLAQWKDYMKKLSTTLNRKGKRVFHPVRVALTGRWAGPDVGAQLYILAKSQPLLVSGCPIVPVEKRFEALRRYLDAKRT